MAALFCENSLINSQDVEIKGNIGICGDRQVFLGFAAADVLVKASFADIYDENSNRGYQRPFNSPHSAEFRRYIQSTGGTTIPLTFNLRSVQGAEWSLTSSDDGSAILRFRRDSKVFAQVDCQHRLGHLGDVTVSLAFMTFIGLTIDDERRVFTTINSKAKGLSGSLLDANLAKIADDLSVEVPSLYIAMRLADDLDSPWLHRLRKGGATTGMKKTVSLRMMNRGCGRFLKELKGRKGLTVVMAADIAKTFWRAVASTFPREWTEPRKHFIAKGVGIYSLMSLGGQLASNALTLGRDISESYFANILSDHLGNFDWSHDGPLNNFNGAKGAEQALRLLRDQIHSHTAKENKLTWQTRTSS